MCWGVPARRHRLAALRVVVAPTQGQAPLLRRRGWRRLDVCGFEQRSRLRQAVAIGAGEDDCDGDVPPRGAQVRLASTCAPIGWAHAGRLRCVEHRPDQLVEDRSIVQERAAGLLARLDDDQEGLQLAPQRFVDVPDELLILDSTGVPATR